MILVWGQRVCGRVDVIDGGFVATKFFHLWYLPLIPSSSFLIVPANARGIESTETPLVWRSVLAGYFRTWGVLAAGASLLGWLASQESLGASLGPLFVFVLGVAAVIVSWTVLRRPPVDVSAQRRVYAEHVGVSVDVAMLGAQREPLRDHLREILANDARSIAAGSSYRAPASGGEDWLALAQHPDVRDRAFLGAAMTRARIEWGTSRGERRRELAAAHARIWEKIKGLHAGATA